METGNRRSLPRPQTRPRRALRRPTAQRTPVLSYEYWQRRFGARPLPIFGRPFAGSAGAKRAPVPVCVAPHFQLLFPPDANLGFPAGFLGLRAASLTTRRTGTTFSGSAIGRIESGRFARTRAG